MSSKLNTMLENFLQYEGKPITLPHHFNPDPKLFRHLVPQVSLRSVVDYHRENVFVA
ncbi:hypothetical protein [Pelagicoccus sp. SDUM812002]|uniref:hypothetical protein n=1 Tax=Pelagicoccus sp. SDUM812002 TaxID=3041266 RepID=UPI00280CB21C|nr:hypothetical protein [Pelagicoccus sp. SDUM812002]MDQ8187095.1 hypothetical protein [Pelagicoccus sp. SDUM812002]